MCFDPTNVGFLGRSIAIDLQTTGSMDFNNGLVRHFVQHILQVRAGNLHGLKASLSASA